MFAGLIILGVLAASIAAATSLALGSGFMTALLVYSASGMIVVLVTGAMFYLGAMMRSPVKQREVRQLAAPSDSPFSLS